MINIDERLLDLVDEKELKILLLLVKRINKNFESWPSLSLLKKESGFGIDKLRNAIIGLIDKKIISRRQTKNNGQFSHTVYKILTSYCGVYINAKNVEFEIIEDDRVIENHDTENPTTKKPTLSINEDLSINQNKEYSEDLNSRIKFYNSIIEYFPQKIVPKISKDAEKWLEDIRLLIEKDNCTYEVLEKIITTFRNDDFWSSNFMSLLKLRKKNKTGIMYIDYFQEKLKLNQKFNKNQYIPLGNKL